MIRELFILGGAWILFWMGFFLLVRGSALGQKKGDILWEEAPEESSRSDERRRYQRHYLPFPVTYASLEQLDFQEVTLTEDVGKGGVRFPTRYPLRQGSRLYLSIEIPRDSPLSLFGEVVWQKQRPIDAPRLDTGIKFVNVSTSNIIRIARHL